MSATVGITGPMAWLLVGLAVLVAGAFGCLLRPKRASDLAVGSVLAGSLCLLIPAFSALLGGETASLSWPWAVPFGAFALGLDPLTGFFLVPTLLIAVLGAIYGSGYLQAERGSIRHAAHWTAFGLLVASMVLVLTARNGLLFLVAWESMALTSFFLVVHDGRDEAVAKAGWTYLVAAHLGTAALLVLFALMGHAAGSLDFARIGVLPDRLADAAFLLAVVGFGTKAGFLPLHVWLPEAHPAAPSHVSALMSAVMIETGLYALLRLLGFLGTPPAWWGWLLVGIGALSALTGIASALAQSDLKRLLAYSSVENVGLMTLAFGLGLLGISLDRPELAVLGFAGGLLHLLNHALIKALLFFGAGAVLHATGTRDMEALGGVLKRMPRTGTLFAFGSLAIVALPPLNGFSGEILIYLGAFKGVVGGQMAATVPGIVIIGTLALVGGVAAAAFARAFGIAFLGNARSDAVTHAHEAPLAMLAPMAVLAGGCLVSALATPWLLTGMAPLLAEVSGLPQAAVSTAAAGAQPTLRMVTGIGVALVVLVGFLAGLRARLLRDRSVNGGPTWACGYARPTARIQYTGASFAQPLGDSLRGLARVRRRTDEPAGLFPSAAALAIETADLWREAVYQPVFTCSQWALGRFRWMHHGRVQLYVLYIAVTLIVLLVWQLL